jgi:circadian clock protein KaiB
VSVKKEFHLVLFISGASPNSVRAVNNIKAICEDFLRENYRLEIIDVHQIPEVAEKEQIIALPTLIKRGPKPQRRLVGDLSDKEKVLKGLGINF